MLSVFPEPYDDELLYSVLSRFARAAPIKRTYPLGFNPNSRFGFFRVADWLALFNLRQPDVLLSHLVLQNSLLPYRLPLIRSAVRPFVFEELLAQRGLTKLSFMTAWVMRTAHPSSSRSQPLRYCPDCVRLDIQRVQESYWHRIHQLPCTAVCLEHNCRLVLHQSPAAWSAGPPSMPRMHPQREMSSRAWPLLVRLAAFDRLFLELGHYGFAGDHIGNALQAEPHLLGVPHDLRRRGTVARIRELESAPWAQVLSDPGLPLLAKLDPMRFRNAVDDPTLVSPAAVVVMLSLLRLDPAPLLMDAPQYELLSRDVDTCGSRFCRQYTPVWFAEARERQDQVGGTVYAACRACGFRARLRPFSEETVIVNRGSAWSEMKEELAAEGVLSPYDQRTVLELPDAVYMHGRKKLATAKQRRLPKPRRKTGTNGGRGSIDGPHFRTRRRRRRDHDRDAIHSV